MLSEFKQYSSNQQKADIKTRGCVKTRFQLKTAIIL